MAAAKHPTTAHAAKISRALTRRRRGRVIAHRAMPALRHCPALLSGLAALLLLAGCGRILEDNGTRLAYDLERGTRQLRASGANELVVRYETLDGPAQDYYIEMTPSIHPSGARPDVAHSVLVVSGRTSGATTYHNRFVFVPARLYLRKDAGGPAEIVLRRQGEKISVVELR